jgi:hypothetical protein
VGLAGRNNRLPRLALASQGGFCYHVLNRGNGCQTGDTGRVEEWRGGLGVALRVGWPFRLPVPEYPTLLRFHSPLIELDVRICRIQLSDKVRKPAHAPA